MKLNAVSLADKTSKIKFDRTAYNEAIARAIGQSDKDYFHLSQPKSIQQIQTNPSDFIKNAMKFFANILGQ